MPSGPSSAVTKLEWRCQNAVSDSKYAQGFLFTYNMSCSNDYLVSSVKQPHLSDFCCLASSSFWPSLPPPFLSLLSFTSAALCPSPPHHGQGPPVRPGIITLLSLRDVGSDTLGSRHLCSHEWCFSLSVVPWTWHLGSCKLQLLINLMLLACCLPVCCEWERENRILWEWVSWLT